MFWVIDKINWCRIIWNFELVYIPVLINSFVVTSTGDPMHKCLCTLDTGYSLFTSWIFKFARISAHILPIMSQLNFSENSSDYINVSSDNRFKVRFIEQLPTAPNHYLVPVSEWNYDLHNSTHVVCWQKRREKNVIVEVSFSWTSVVELP